MNLVFPLCLSSLIQLQNDTEIFAEPTTPVLYIQFNNTKKEFQSLELFEQLEIFSDVFLIFQDRDFDREHFSLTYQLKINFEDFQAHLKASNWRYLNSEKFQNDHHYFDLSNPEVEVLLTHNIGLTPQLLTRSIDFTLEGKHLLFTFFSRFLKFKFDYVSSSFRVGKILSTHPVTIANPTESLCVNFIDLCTILKDEAPWPEYNHRYLNLIDLISGKDGIKRLSRSFAKFLPLCKFKKLCVYFSSQDVYCDVLPAWQAFFTSLEVERLEIAIHFRAFHKINDILSLFKGFGSNPDTDVIILRPLEDYFLN